MNSGDPIETAAWTRSSSADNAPKNPKSHHESASRISFSNIPLYLMETWAQRIALVGGKAQNGAEKEKRWRAGNHLWKTRRWSRLDHLWFEFLTLLMLLLISTRSSARRLVVLCFVFINIFTLLQFFLINFHRSQFAVSFLFRRLARPLKRPLNIIYLIFWLASNLGGKLTIPAAQGEGASDSLERLKLDYRSEAWLTVILSLMVLCAPSLNRIRSPVPHIWRR